MKSVKKNNSIILELFLFCPRYEAIYISNEIIFNKHMIRTGYH